MMAHVPVLRRGVGQIFLSAGETWGFKLMVSSVRVSLVSQTRTETSKTSVEVEIAVMT